MIQRQSVNVVLITCHDLGRYLGCYGIDTVKTPHVDSIAQQGLRFTQSFAAAPQCSPARAAITTGRHPHCTGVLGLTHGRFAWDLTDDQLTLPQYLCSQGYHTVLAGLQHEANRTARLGFDERIASCPGHDFAGVSCMDIADHVDGFLAEHKGSDKPFYLQVGLFEPHRDPASPTGFTQGFGDAEQDVTVPGFLSDTPEVRKELGEFQAAVQLADKAVGQMLQSLADHGMAGNTLVIFTADHGMPFPRAKCTLYDPGLEVPVVMSGPMLDSQAGKDYNGLMSMIDLYPTICELLGLAVPQTVQGVSHAGAMFNHESAREELYAEMTYHDYYDPLRCIRTDRYKLIASFEATRAWMDPTQQWVHRSQVHDSMEKAGLRHPPLRLYDLQNDPAEVNNLAGDTKYAAVCQDLAGRLLDQMRQTDDPVLYGMPSSPAHRQAVNCLMQAAGRHPQSQEKREVEVLP
ncbi:MAG: sulfatase [Phycisphaeraceae bacterium]|nr:sulfatase [Phycisphaeraceae bacterium]